MCSLEFIWNCHWKQLFLLFLLFLNETEKLERKKTKETQGGREETDTFLLSLFSLSLLLRLCCRSVSTASLTRSIYQVLALERIRTNLESDCSLHPVFQICLPFKRKENKCRLLTCSVLFRISFIAVAL